jgi:L-asparaginase
MSARPALIIHGGAGSAFKDERRKSMVRESLARIVDEAYAALAARGSLEACVHAVSLLEDDPLFNAGIGARLQSDGRSRLSAAVMDGATGRFAGVMNVENIRHPVQVARALLAEKDRNLAGEGAYRYAVERLGMKPMDTRTDASVAAWRLGAKGSDTVGACAVDADGWLCAATSTGGKGGEIPGRVSDSPMPVATFADERVAVSATGTGEEIIEEGLAIKIAVRVRDGLTMERAFEKSFAEAASARRGMGAIGLDAEGRFSWAKTTPSLIYAWKNPAGTGLF